MIRIHLSADDITHTRFAFSALWEVIASYRCLINPDRHTLHLPWIHQAHDSLRGLDLSLLGALVRPVSLGPSTPDMGLYTPDFLTPPPTTPLPDFQAELEALRQTPAEIIKREVSHAYEGETQLADAARPYLSDPQTSLNQLAELLARYWECVIAPYWPRLRALLEGDVLYRAYKLATEGPQSMFSDLHTLVSYAPGTLEIHKSREDEVRPNRGILLIPVAFSWPNLYVITDPPWPTTLAYSPRGLGGLWIEERPPTSEGLKLFLGEGRALLMKCLLVPSTTGQLAQQLGITAGAVSQHLTQLKKSGVVESYRRGRHVFYRLNDAGHSLLKIFEVVK